LGALLISRGVQVLTSMGLNIPTGSCLFHELCFQVVDRVGFGYGSSFRFRLPQPCEAFVYVGTPLAQRRDRLI